MGAEAAAGGLRDAEVAVLEESPEAVPREGAAVGMGHAEGLAAPHPVHGTTQLVCSRHSAFQAKLARRWPEGVRKSQSNWRTRPATPEKLRRDRKSGVKGKSVEG